MSTHGPNSVLVSSSVDTVSVLTAAPPIVRGEDLPEKVWYGLLTFLALVTIANASSLAWASYQRRRARHRVSTTEPSNGVGRLSLRRLPHAVLTTSRIIGFRLRVPLVDLNIAELAFVAVYFGGCLAWCFAIVDPGWTYPDNLSPRAWAYRTGKLVAIQLPFVVLLSLKNNVITWLTGIGHEKLNLMHRVVSRCILLLAWLHIVGMYFRDSTKLLTTNWKISGLIGAIAFNLTTLGSPKWVRRRFYEPFYVSHVVLVIIFLVCVHIHVRAKGFDMYIWGAWAVWIFDRLIRLGRYVLFNIVLRPQNPHALIEALGADAMRITLKRRIPGGWCAGQHVFLAFPTLGLQSHPFTIVSPYEPGAKKVENGGGSNKEAEMVFVVRAMDGQTRKLLDRALLTGSCELPAMVDGPYGCPDDIRPFSTCVFIAGGTGITYTLGRMHQLLRDVRAADACARRVVFIWVVRNETEYEWVATDLAQVVSAAPPSLSLTADVYFTGTNGGTLPETVPTLEKTADSEVDLEKGGAASPVTASSSSSSSDCEKRAPNSQGGVTVRRRAGRPDVYRILEEEITAAQGAVAVDVSGPDGLVDAVRRALCAPFAGPVSAMKGAPTVLLSVEQFRL